MQAHTYATPPPSHMAAHHTRALPQLHTDGRANTTSLAPKLLQYTKQLVTYNAFAAYGSLHRLYVEVSELTSVPNPTK